MLTPNNYKEHLKNKEITLSMINDGLVSLAQRAKNQGKKECEYRERKFHGFIDTYDSEKKHRDKKKEYYEDRNTILNIFEPQKMIKAKRIFRSGRSVESYYLVYIIDGKTHFRLLKPGEENDYKELLRDDIQQVSFHSKDIPNDLNDVLAVPFVKKMVELIESDEYNIIYDNNQLH